jgi:phosphopantothenoylcysteine synthetase/decarboxylase
MSHAEFIAAYDQLSQWAQQSGMAPAIASTTNNTALWLRSAPLANALVANAQRWNAPCKTEASQPGTTTPIYAHESLQAAFCAASESLFLINRGS